METRRAWNQTKLCHTKLWREEQVGSVEKGQRKLEVPLMHAFVPVYIARCIAIRCGHLSRMSRQGNKASPGIYRRRTKINMALFVDCLPGIQTA